MPLYQIIVSIALLASLCASGIVWSQKNNVKNLRFEVIASYPHHNHLYTQGLEFHNGDLYESAGQYGQSQILRYSVDFDRREVLQKVNSKRISAKYFAEGISIVNGDLWLLTWKRQQLFIFATDTFALTKPPLQYRGEGWGLADKGSNTVIRSDGTKSLIIHSTDSMKVLSTHTILYKGQPINRWNELEWFEPQALNKPLLMANRWFDNNLYIIDLTKQGGRVSAVLDLSDLVDKQPDSAEVLNGIAWNNERQTLWVTGKYWSTIYELKIKF